MFGFLGLFVAVNGVFEARTCFNFFRFSMIFLRGFFSCRGVAGVYFSRLPAPLPLTYGADVFARGSSWKRSERPSVWFFSCAVCMSAAGSCGEADI
ncbi:hypothetical protein CHL67_01370 [Prosthecochloris sp. GSB1]|nr:hypothetical protein CHL67_01370 [Prosthecochloris sp. GSB1]